MAAEPENILLVYLHRIDQRQERMQATLDEVLLRLDGQHQTIAHVRTAQAADAETVAHLQAQLDRVKQDVARINRRLDIVD